jgi:hypothetical protein
VSQAEQGPGVFFYLVARGKKKLPCAPSEKLYGVGIGGCIGREVLDLDLAGWAVVPTEDTPDTFGYG